MIEYLPGWPEGFVWVLVLGFIAAAVLSFGMGANDCANSYGTSVGSGVLTHVQAYMLATVFETLGAGLLGYKVTDTVRKSIVNVTIYDTYALYNHTEFINLTSTCVNVTSNLTDVECARYTGAEYMIGSLGSLIGAAIWLCIANVLKLPVSTTHAAVGATIGYSLVLKGSDGIQWATVGSIVASWVISPVMAGVLSIICYIIVKYAALNKRDVLNASLATLPFFYFFTIAVNLFMILFSGSKYLHLDQLPVWIDIIVALGVGGLVGLLCWFVLVDRIRKWVLRTGFITPPTAEFMNGNKPQIELKSISSPPSPKLSRSGDVGDVDPEAGGDPDREREKLYVAPLKPLALQRVKAADSGIYLTPTARSVPGSAPRTPGTATPPNYANPGEDGELVSRTPNRIGASIRSGLDAISLKEKLVALKDPVEESPQASKVFSALQVLSACFMSFTHGSNDTANGVGALVGIWVNYRTGYALSDMTNDFTAEGIILYGAGCMVIGLWCLGHKVIKTVGRDITEVTPASGFSMELGTATTVLIASQLGIPISTTHCLVGAVVFVGWYKTHKGVSWKIFRNIAIAWAVTLPISGGIAALSAYLLRFALR